LIAWATLILALAVASAALTIESCSRTMPSEAIAGCTANAGFAVAIVLCVGLVGGALVLAIRQRR
jgi:hypothetical protein